MRNERFRGLCYRFALIGGLTRAPRHCHCVSWRKSIGELLRVCDRRSTGNRTRRLSFSGPWRAGRDRHALLAAAVVVGLAVYLLLSRSGPLGSFGSCSRRRDGHCECALGTPIVIALAHRTAVGCGRFGDALLVVRFPPATLWR